MLPVHSPDCARGWSALEMSLDTNELQSSKKTPPKNEIIQFIPWEVALLVLVSLPRDGSSPGAASRWSCPWWGRQRADQTPPDLPQENFFQQNTLFLMDLWHFPGVLQETRGGVRGQGQAAPGSDAECLGGR